MQKAGRRILRETPAGHMLATPRLELPVRAGHPQTCTARLRDLEIIFQIGADREPARKTRSAYMPSMRGWGALWGEFLTMEDSFRGKADRAHSERGHPAGHTPPRDFAASRITGVHQVNCSTGNTVPA